MTIEAADVERQVGRTFDADETEACEAAIADYQAELESWLGRAVGLESRTVTTLVRYDVAEIPLVGPVQSINSVVVGADTLAVDRYEVAPTGVLLRSYLGYTGSEHVSVTVTYVGGIPAPKNRPAVAAIIARTARYMNKRRDDAISAETVSTEGYSVKYEADAFTEAELKACSRLKRRVVAGPVPVHRPFGY